MATEVWVSLVSRKFPSDIDDFTGYVVGQYKVMEVLEGARSLKEKTITLVGNVPTVAPMLQLRLRVKKDWTKVGEWKILVRAGFKGFRRTPLTVGNFGWITKNEMNPATRRSAVRALKDAMPDDSRTTDVVEKSWLEGQTFFPSMRKQSDYWRMDAVAAAYRGWPEKIEDIRGLSMAKLEELLKIMVSNPHHLCFFAHAKQFGELGELTHTGLCSVLDYVGEAGLKAEEGGVTTREFHKVAVRFYAKLKESLSGRGHTIFEKKAAIQRYLVGAPGDKPVFMPGFFWMLKGGYLYILDKSAGVVDRANWTDPEEAAYLQLPHHHALMMRTVSNLKRIRDNFEQEMGVFQWRDSEDPLPCKMRGSLNKGQRVAMDHVLENWLTVIQGGPGTGKTALGVEHVASIFVWPDFQTHVGRQAISLVGRLGGHPDGARTIHSSYYSFRDNEVMQEYKQMMQVLVMDEVYNADEWTFNAALESCPGASRLVLVGDPDQIRPIPDFRGAGTPALDVAKNFQEHLIKLDENMRVDPDALIIDSVNRSINAKQPIGIPWTHSLDQGPAVMINPAGMETRTLVYSLIERLRKGTRGNEERWQLITFFNGGRPKSGAPQRFGVVQLNQLCEDYLRTTGFFASSMKRTQYKINKSLTLYRGKKIIFTKTAVHEDAKRKETGFKSKYSVVKNGQLEVVRKVKRFKTKKSRAIIYEVTCYPKEDGNGAPPAVFVISKKRHVDPFTIKTAWAITSNKSMGGECHNVGVWIPDAFGQTFPDRTHLYVGTSRAIKFLVLVGSRSNFISLVMRDPLPINTAMDIILRAPYPEVTDREDDGDEDATPYPMDDSPSRDWKTVYPIEEPRLHPDLRDAIDVYDQSTRDIVGYPISVCPITYNQFAKGKRRAKKRKVKR